ncbi:MAG: ywlC [Anaerocolumna sp.]|jgi:L-threonylcarbamoyladenylate synthase|nr:ywlC [Anaerocolumna sp.]
MNTEIIKVEDNHIEEQGLKRAVQILKNSGLVAFPTETVYGLGGDALNKSAAGKIYCAKGRPSDNPLIVHIADLKALEDLTDFCPENGIKLANAFWPGPLTLIFKKSSKVPDSTTGGLDSVAIRMPSHPIALELIKASGLYLAAPSANISGRPSPTNAEHVIEDMSGIIDMIIDGGKVDIGLESTIVDLTGSIPTVLRPGFITVEMLESIVGEVLVDQVVVARTADPNMIPKAPGMKYKHYAPKGDITIYEGESEVVVKTINEAAKELVLKGLKTGIIATSETYNQYPFGTVKVVGTREDETTIARGLFEVLRDFDTEGIDYIFAESFDNNRLGQAIMNRLLKAAGYHIIKV